MAKFSLPELKDALIFSSVKARLFQPLRAFFQGMQLCWEDVSTACAYRRGGKQIIALGEKFFTESVHSAAHGAQIILHEILHHLFRHLDLDEPLLKRGFDRRIQNLAMDAIINAYLARVGLADFMQGFYPDKGALAFLRPGSEILAQDSLVSKELADEFIGEKYRHCDVVLDEMREFYGRLQALEVTLDESLCFFKEHFNAERNDETETPFLGDHSMQSKSQRSSTMQETGSRTADREDFFAQPVKHELLKVVAVTTATSQSFANVIKQLSTCVVAPGAQPKGTELRSRLPARICHADLLRIAAGRNHFRNKRLCLKEVAILFDLSGSMHCYVPFVVGLVDSLHDRQHKVRAFCWASEIVEVSFADFRRGKLPGREIIGEYTNGEGVAAFIVEQGLKEVVIITDNEAGELDTKINAKVHLCLTEGASTAGSFLDSSKVPRCRVWNLKLEGRHGEQP